MRAHRKSKEVDTVKAQKLVEVRMPNHRRLPITVDSLHRVLIVSRCSGCDSRFGLDFNPYLTRHCYRRRPSLGALRPHNWAGRTLQHSSPNMSRLQVLLQRRKTQTVQRSRPAHAARFLVRLDGGQQTSHRPTSPFSRDHPPAPDNVREQRPEEKHRCHRHPIPHGVGGVGYLRSIQDSTPETPRCDQPSTQAVQVQCIHLPGGHRQPCLTTGVTRAGRPKLVLRFPTSGPRLVPSQARDLLSPDVPRPSRHEDELAADPLAHRPVSLPRLGIPRPRDHLTLRGNP
jgi:hypothetical protein